MSGAVKMMSSIDFHLSPNRKIEKNNGFLEVSQD